MARMPEHKKQQLTFAISSSTALLYDSPLAMSFTTPSSPVFTESLLKSILMRISLRRHFAKNGVNWLTTQPVNRY